MLCYHGLSNQTLRVPRTMAIVWCFGHRGWSIIPLKDISGGTPHMACCLTQSKHVIPPRHQRLQLITFLLCVCWGGHRGLPLAVSTHGRKDAASRLIFNRELGLCFVHSSPTAACFFKPREPSSSWSRPEPDWVLWHHW